MYTIDFTELTDYNISTDCPYIIKEVEENSFDYESAKDMGLLFEMPDKAFQKAREIFYRTKYHEMSDITQECTRLLCNVYSEKTKTIEQTTESEDVELNMDRFIAKRRNSDRTYFSSEEKAKEAIEKIGYVEFVKYVLGLRNVELFVPTMVK